MARPTKLTAEIQEKICRAIRAGNYPSIAARSCGIGESTFYRWMERGRSAKGGIHRDFYEAVRQAEAESEVHAVATLRKGAATDWRAAEAILKRRHGHNWGGKELRVPEFEEQRPTIDLTKLSERELKLLEKVCADPSEQS